MNESRFLKEREHYPLLHKWAYFETAATGAIPDYVYDGYRGYQEQRYWRGGDSSWQGNDSFIMIEWARGQLAEMLGGSKKGLAFGENTSQMFAQFAAGLPLSAGDNIVLTSSTFPSMAYAWDLRRQREGVELRCASAKKGRVELEEIIGLADTRTRVISLSHVESGTGFRHDLAALGEFCRKHDILLATDTAQSAGVMPVYAEDMGIDFLAGNNYKWMQGFCGVGYGWFSNRALTRLQPLMAGWKSRKDISKLDDLTLELSGTASRYEYGFPNVPGIYAMGNVAQRYLALGAGNIERYILKLVAAVHEQASRRPGLIVWSDYKPANLSQIVILTADERYKLETQALLNANVVAVVKDGKDYGAKYALRLGLHYYNSLEDIERLFEAINSTACGT